MVLLKYSYIIVLGGEIVESSDFIYNSEVAAIENGSEKVDKLSEEMDVEWSLFDIQTLSKL